MLKFNKKKKKSNKSFPLLFSIDWNSKLNSNLEFVAAREGIRVSVNRVSIGEVGRTWVSRTYANAPRFFFFCRFQF